MWGLAVIQRIQQEQTDCRVHRGTVAHQLLFTICYFLDDFGRALTLVPILCFAVQKTQGAMARRRRCPEQV
jgi:hypothetical protein